MRKAGLLLLLLGAFALHGCIAIMTNVHAPLGRLPAGTCTVTVVVRGEESEAEVYTFAVTNGTSIPTLGPASLSVLLAALPAIGLVATRSLSA